MRPLALLFIIMSKCFSSIFFFNEYIFFFLSTFPTRPTRIAGCCSRQLLHLWRAHLSNKSQLSVAGCRIRQRSRIDPSFIVFFFFFFFFFFFCFPFYFCPFLFGDIVFYLFFLLILFPDIYVRLFFFFLSFVSFCCVSFSFVAFSFLFCFSAFFFFR